MKVFAAVFVVLIGLGETLPAEYNVGETEDVDVPLLPSESTYDIKSGVAENRCPEKCTCSTNLAIVNCNGKKFSEIPPNIPSSATVLYLDNNVISKIKKDSFKNLSLLKQLYIKKNRISVIEAGGFHGLSALKCLSLTSNKLKELGADVLSDLKGLERLYLTKNDLIEVPDFVSVPMSNLTQLTVDTNKIVNADICKGKREIMFDKLGDLVFSNNQIISISQNDLSCISPDKLFTINLSRCKLNTIDKNVFTAFVGMKSATVSYNERFTWTTLQNFTAAVSLKDMSSLDLSGVFVKKELKFNSSTFSNLRQSTIRYLMLSHSSNVSIIENGTFAYFPKLETLDLSVGEIYEIEDSMETLKRLKDLRLRQNKLKTASIRQLKIPSLQSLNLEQVLLEELTDDLFLGLRNLEYLTLKRCQIKIIHAGAFAGLPNLKNLDLSNNELGGNNVPSKLFSGCPNLMNIDLSSNKMTTISTQYTLFQGLYQLEVLDLSNNECYNISEEIFMDQKNLQHLNLAKNKLGQYFFTFDQSLKLFDSLKSLLTLDMSNNEISTLPRGIFDGLLSLITLNLTYNSLMVLSAPLYRNNLNLIIDMSKNKVTSLAPNDIKELPQNVSTNLSSNPFDCSCDLRPFMYWLKDADSSYRESKLKVLSTYKCGSPHSLVQKPLLSFDPNSIIAFCNWGYILFGSLVMLFIVGVVTALLVFHYRWNIRLYWYIFKKKFKKPKKGKSRIRKERRGYGTIPTDDPDDPDERYEVSVSYCNEGDETLVLHNLIPQLIKLKNGTANIPEDPPDGFIFAIGHNSSLSRCTFDEIAEAFDKSDKILLCISKKYLESSRCAAEVQMAMHSRFDQELDITGNKGIFLVFLESELDVKVPPTLRPFIRYNSIQWFPDEDSTKQQMFWIDLCNFLNISAPMPVSYQNDGEDQS